jgi:hypothetical protein
MEGGKHSAADVVAQAQALLTEPELLRAMFDVGYFPRTRRQAKLRWASHFEYCTRIRSNALLAAFIAAPRVGYS